MTATRERRPCSNRDCGGGSVVCRPGRRLPAYCSEDCQREDRNRRARVRRAWERANAGLLAHQALERAGQPPLVPVDLPPLPALPTEAHPWVPEGVPCDDPARPDTRA